MAYHCHTLLSLSLTAEIALNMSTPSSAANQPPRSMPFYMEWGYIMSSARRRGVGELAINLVSMTSSQHNMLLVSFCIIGCSFREMWDEEDPGNQDRPLFCEEIRSRVPTPFLPAFTNSDYTVLQVATVNNTM